MPDLAEIDRRIALLRENLRELIEQAAAYSGAADEDLVAQRITEMEEELENLDRQRQTIVGTPS